MNTDDINKAYVSPYDKFLYEFDATHKKSASQLHEIKKHERIFKMRDDKDYKINQSEIWEGF
ncbi:hypothetical protein PGH45_15315 [Legionella pneumophila]|nr:hypothetical protein [Legionella pneumophila]